jgi:enediyne biosynthesis protein E4
VKSLCVALSFVLCLPFFPAPPAFAQALETVYAPPAEKDVTAEQLAAREKLQREAARGYEVFHGFRFTDRLAESGITFRNRVVDDAGKYAKAVHYDHGNGISAADVDGDGWTDLYFLTQIGSNELWRNRGDGTFENWTARAGVGLSDRISVTASFGDVDNDGDADLFVTTVRMGNVLFRNRGDGTFEDATEASGLGHVGHSSGASFLDYDRDGDLDLFVTNVGAYTDPTQQGRGGAFVGLDRAFMGHMMPERTEASLLYENGGDGTFREVSRAKALVDTSWSGDVSATDFDGDLWPDLYVLNMQGDDHYWENQGGDRFVDRTAAAFPRSPWGAMGVQFFDWNNDGRLDLYLTDMHSDMMEPYPPFVQQEEKKKSVWNPDLPVLQGGRNNVFGNAFWQAREDGSFEEVSDRVGAENLWPWGLSVGDLNNDGYQDAFLASSMNYPFRYALNSVLLNESGETFRDAEFLVGVEPRPQGADYRVPWFDLDCSGADSRHFQCEGRSGAVRVTGNLGTRSSVILDIDRDGDLDIITNEFNSPPQFLVNDLSSGTGAGHWLEVTLEGSVSNRDGLGSWVSVTTADQTHTRYHDGKSGYLSQSLVPLYFGLADATTVKEVTVRWPSGLVQSVSAESGLAVDGRIHVREPVPSRVEVPRKNLSSP